MSHVGWRTEYATGVDAMDLQHRKLFGIMEVLYHDLQTGGGVAHGDMEGILAELLGYARTHFHDEEDLMRRHFYPQLREHILLHGELAEQLVQHIDEFRYGTLPPLKLALFLRHWIVDHIQHADHAYGEFIMKRKA